MIQIEKVALRSGIRILITKQNKMKMQNVNTNIDGRIPQPFISVFENMYAKEHIQKPCYGNGFLLQNLGIRLQSIGLVKILQAENI